VSTVALAFVLWDGGAFNMSLGTLSLFAIVPALVGMYLGQKMRARISAQTFLVLMYLGLVALALNLLWKYLG